jgi:hypothetical protein
MNKNYEIIQNKDNEYELIIKNTNKIVQSLLYKSIQKQIPCSHHNEETNKLYFISETVEPLNNYIEKHKILRTLDPLQYITNNETLCIKMIDCISQQFFFLNNNNYAFYGLDLNSIIVINDEIFVVTDPQYLLPVEDNHFLFYFPFKIPYFGNPEILRINKLPERVHYKCCFYSLGVLIVFFLTTKYLLVGNEVQCLEDIEKIINPFKKTKLYWFIKRCLKPKVEERILLLI